MKTFVLFFLAMTSMVMADTTTKNPDPSDPQIAMILVTANQVDIDAGKYAQSKSTNQEVKKFAEQMVMDHTFVNKSATDLVGKLKVTPEASDMSDELKSDGQTALLKMKKLTGKQFDKAYIDNEVTYHQEVLGHIDQVLLPSADNQELRDLIVKVRPSIASHLDHAKRIQKTLK